ncbi:MAG: hypothetical protein LBB94_01860 [Clostridiales bacterium]|jgi:hypothetical protein|nr:hypothetical protein [Clostridiales bacterium]
MPKPIDQINEEFQTEFIKSTTNTNSVNPISFMDTSPNGLTLPPRYTSAYAEEEHSPSGPKIRRRRGGKSRKKYKRRKGRKAKKPALVRRLAVIAAGTLVFLSIFVYLLSALIYVNLRYDPLSVLGYYILPQTSNIMAPEINQNSLLIVQSVEPSTLDIGDTIVIRQNQALFITTKIISFVENADGLMGNGFFTRGANEGADASYFTEFSRVKGRVVLCVPIVGGIMSSISNNLLTAGVIYICIMIFINTLRKLFSSD